MTVDTLRMPGSMDELLNYRLLRLLVASLAPVTRLVEQEFGITRREWRLVAVLAEQGPTSPSQLAERVHLDRARTSRAITRLVGKGWVSKQVTPGDRRHAVVRLTERGEQGYGDLFPRVRAINQHLLAALDDPQVAVLDACLDALLAQAKAMSPR